MEISTKAAYYQGYEDAKADYQEALQESERERLAQAERIEALEAEVARWRRHYELCEEAEQCHDCGEDTCVCEGAE